MAFEQKQFAEWLFEQPATRAINYCDQCNCVLAAFAKEKLGLPEPRVWPHRWVERPDGGEKKIPDWLIVLLASTDKSCRGDLKGFWIDMDDLQGTYRTLFGDPEKSPTTVTDYGTGSQSV